MTRAASAKIVPFARLATRLAARHRAGRRIVLTNGVFDLMHIGHLRYLAAARAMGDLLLVGVNSDAATRRLKGLARPYVAEAERAEMLAGLECVDLVTIFPQDTAIELARVARPAVYVKGGDYQIGEYAETVAGGTTVANGPVKPLPEEATIIALGGRVALVAYLPGHSTTELIARIVAGSEPR